MVQEPAAEVEKDHVVVAPGPTSCESGWSARQAGAWSEKIQWSRKPPRKTLEQLLGVRVQIATPELLRLLRLLRLL